MDNLTHSLVGALLGQAGLKRKTGLAMPALIIGANLPDVDAACFFWLDGVEHLGFRRGITHGPIALVLLPLILAGLLYGFDRWQAKRGKRPEGRLPVSFKWLFLLAFIGCLTHPALDWLNVYGIRLLEPFSSQWFYGDTLFIIDVWLWALMGFATWFSLRREKRGGDYEESARWALGIGILYIAANSVITSLVGAMASGQPAIESPRPLTSWQREVIEPYRAGKWQIDGEVVGECALEPVVKSTKSNSQAEAFLFWSRAPFAERQPDGSVILRDARYYDPRARDRFSVALPDVKCEPLGE
ncbi:metal-dependent hydrolase [Allopontixanthobacter sp.]|uniref:metal-dependent hydrolase n=1 Tax=Allopontixanthobacter sp. TaxID=2906452 RepID=UPI002AB80BF3|nr:metal-dependent hydrolase [Allopontixanthobacter sp.]MDZ4308011.1 metal-dependent hydrolase [Allopontixanthobacter sp.]